MIFHVNIGQAEVVVDAEGVDGPQVGDPVLVRQQVSFVHGHLKLTVCAIDLQLQRQAQRDVMVHTLTL